MYLPQVPSIHAAETRLEQKREGEVVGEDIAEFERIVDLESRGNERGGLGEDSDGGVEWENVG